MPMPNMQEPTSVLVVDFPSRGPMHSGFNGALLRIIRLAFPNATITTYAQAAHNAVLREETNDLEGLAWETRPPIYDGEKLLPAFKTNLQHLRAQLDGAKKARHTIEQAAADIKADLIVIVCPAPLVMGALRFAKLPKAVPIHHIFFGQIKAARERALRNPIWKTFTLRNDIRFGAMKTVRFIMLEKHLENAFHTYMGNTRYPVFTLDHPLPTVAAAPRHEALSKPVKCAFLGMAVPPKGFSGFVEIARKLASEDLEFHGLGHLGNNVDHLDLTPLTTRPTGDKLPQDIFVQKLLEMDCIVQPMSAAYANNASGTLLDAIAYEKPFFCLKNDVMDTLEDAHGPIGYAASDLDDLAQAVQDFADGKYVDAQAVWLENQRAVKKARSLETLAAKYRDYILGGE
ncbi:MAG: hypothetical protein AAF562_04690 [Pseudomonadota bacterium]